jgi:hypothetical protein
MNGKRIIWVRRCAGMLWVVSVFSPLSTGLGASPTLPVPRTRGYMRALVNVNQGLPSYSGYMGKEGLLTDLVFQYGQNTPVRSFAEAKTWFTSHFPPASLGVYCSSRALTPANAQQFDPPNCLTPDQFAESELLPPTFLNDGLRIVDYRQPAARAKLVAGLVQTAKSKQVKWLYADNWSHPSTWDGYISWADTITYMKQLHAALAAQNIGLICNVAIDVSAVSTADLKALGANCEGVSLEMSATPAATADAASTARLVASYQALQSTGCRVIFIPNFQQPQTAIAEAQFLAGLAIILDNTWVAYPFWKDPQNWFEWPGQLGAPTGGIRQEGTTLWRDFNNGTIKLDASTRAATITWKQIHGLR